MAKKIYIDANYPEEIRGVVVKGDNEIEAFEYETSNKKQIKGNIYLGKVTRIEPSLQAAFVDYGQDKHGFYLLVRYIQAITKFRLMIVKKFKKNMVMNYLL
jgi:Rne/Rng family ribonuclease